MSSLVTGGFGSPFLLTGGLGDASIAQSGTGLVLDGLGFPHLLTGGLGVPAPVASEDEQTVTTPYYRVDGPTWGEIARESPAFTITLTDDPGGTVRFTPSASHGAFTPAYVDLHSAKLSASFTYRPKLYGNATISVANDSGLATASLDYDAKIPVGALKPGVHADNFTPDFGGRDHFIAGPYREYYRDCTDDPVDPLSDAIMALSESIAPNGKVYTAGTNQLYSRSFTVVAGNSTPLRSIVLGTYASESDGTGPWPIPDDLQVSGQTTVPTGTGVGDAHAHVYDRDNLKLYEFFKVYRPDPNGPFHAENSVVWDLVAGGGGADNVDFPGGLRPLGHTAATAAGIPLLPFCVRYDEACVHGVIPHAIRITTNNNWNQLAFVHPGRHCATWKKPVAMPYGGRLRLKAAWYHANKDSFGQPGPGAANAARNILDAMYRYGVISTDGGIHFDVDFVSDSRWLDVTRQKLRTIPIAQFEVIQMQRGYEFSVSRASGIVGQAVTFTVTHLPLDDSNFSIVPYLSTDNGATIRGNVGYSNILTPSNRTATLTWSPTATGDYQLTIRAGGGAFQPDAIPYKVYLTAATTYSLEGPQAISLGLPSTYTVSFPEGEQADPTTITPTDNGAGGVFSPTSVSISSESRTATFTYTRSTYGASVIGVANSRSLANPATLTATVANQPRGYILTGPASGLVNANSSNFTVSAILIDGNPFPETIVTPASNLPGQFTPGTVRISQATPSATFSFRPLSVGQATISATNDHDAINPASVSYDSLAVVTGYTLAGPVFGITNSQTTDYTVALAPADGIVDSVTIVPRSTLSGTFSPTSLILTNSVRSGTFRFTPSAIGSGTVSCINNLGLPDAPAIPFAAGPTATAYTFQGPLGGFLNVSSNAFTVALTPTSQSDGLTITPASTLAGTFSPASVTLTTATPKRSFTFRPAAIGTATISVTNGGGLSDPPSISHVVAGVIIAGAGGGFSTGKTGFS